MSAAPTRARQPGRSTAVAIEVQAAPLVGEPGCGTGTTTVTVTIDADHLLPATAREQAALALLLDSWGESAQPETLTHVSLDVTTERILRTLLSEMEATSALATGSGHVLAGAAGVTASARLVAQLLSRYRELAGQRSQQTRAGLLSQLVVETSESLSPASMAQANRDAARRNRLLATPHFSYEELSALRGDRSVNATRTSVSRARSARRLFTVPLPRKGVVIPAFLLDQDGQPRPELEPLLAPLMDAEMGPWQMWTWLTEPAAALSGLVPLEAAADPATAERAARAAHRLADRIVPVDVALAVEVDLELESAVGDRSTSTEDGES